MRRAIALGALVGAFVLASGCLSGGPLTGEPLPAFELVDSTGRLVNETTFLGRWLVLDLMATWCGPCKLEVAHLQEVKRIHGDEVEILSIGVDPTETMDDLERFGEEHGAEWPYAIDRSGELQRRMHMRIIPKLIVVDPQGDVAFEREGEVLPAAITRVIDPTAADPPQVPLLAALAGIGLGFLGAMNPYRALHREAPGRRAAVAALVLLALVGALAWSFAGLASTRATYGSLAIGALSLGAALWWFRARRRLASHAPTPHRGGAEARGDAAENEGTISSASADPPRAPRLRGDGVVRQEAGRWWLAAGDRAYELGASFAAALVLALTGVGASGFFAPLAGFLGGAAGGLATRERLAPLQRDALGLAGLALAGAGLLVFGARILTV